MTKPKKNWRQEVGWKNITYSSEKKDGLNILDHLNYDYPNVRQLRLLCQCVGMPVCRDEEHQKKELCRDCAELLPIFRREASTKNCFARLTDVTEYTFIEPFKNASLSLILRWYPLLYICMLQQNVMFVVPLLLSSSLHIVYTFLWVK